MDTLQVFVGVAPDEVDVVTVMRALELLVVLIPFGMQLGDARFELLMQLAPLEYDAYRAAFGLMSAVDEPVEEVERRRRPEHALRPFCLCLVPAHLRLGVGDPSCLDDAHRTYLAVTRQAP